MPIHVYRCKDSSCEAHTENITLGGEPVPLFLPCKECGEKAQKVPAGCYLDFNMKQMKQWEKEGRPAYEKGMDEDCRRRKKEREEKERAHFVDEGMKAFREITAHI